MKHFIFTFLIVAIISTPAFADVKDILKPVDTSHLDNLPHSNSNISTRLHNGDVITSDGTHYMKVGKDYIGSNGTSYLKVGDNHYMGINTPDVHYTQTSKNTYYDYNGNIYKTTPDYIFKY